MHGVITCKGIDGDICDEVAPELERIASVFPVIYCQYNTVIEDFDPVVTACAGNDKRTRVRNELRLWPANQAGEGKVS